MKVHLTGGADTHHRRTKQCEEISLSFLATHFLCVCFKVVETETRSDPPDESPLLLSTAAGVSLGYIYIGCGHKTHFDLFLLIVSVRPCGCH